MSFITETKLRSYQELSESKLYKFSSKTGAFLTVFLSHSHKDRDLVLSLIEVLARFKIKVYVDWQDSTMPRVTNRITAEGIKKRISALDVFLVLATNNAMNSKWVPWEIGIADNLKELETIAIIPVVDSSGVFTGNEYLQLYPRVDIQNNFWKITNPGQYQSTFFDIWLRNAQIMRLEKSTIWK